VRECQNGSLGTVARLACQFVANWHSVFIPTRVLADTAGMAKRESRFGFGQIMGSVGVALLAVGAMQPWLKLDLEKARQIALESKDLGVAKSGEILFVWSNPDPQVKAAGSEQMQALARTLGISNTGWDQQRYLAAGILLAALIALIGVLRSVFAKTAYRARANAPLLAVAGLAALAIAAVELWVLSPEPHAAMRPAIGLWLIAGGAGCLLLGALTLGNNRRRPWIDDFEGQAPAKQFDNTEHLAYSHGAWVPKNPDDRRS